MSTYFSLFPTTSYNGTNCTDITRRITVRRTITADPRAYQPYEVPAGQRPDQVADGYYLSPDRSWLVYMSTGAIDPYYDWYLGEDDFNAHVVSKYGSMVEAVERIHHWAIAWYDSDATFSPAQWVGVDDNLKQFYEPNFGKGTQVISYSLRADDINASTNMVVTVEVGNNAFVEGERVQVFDGPSLEGSAEVAWSNASHLKLVHVLTGANVGYTVFGVISGESANVVTREYTANVIPEEMRVFWEPVTCLAFERDKNEQLKNVRLIDRTYADSIESQARRLLGANT